MDAVPTDKAARLALGCASGARRGRKERKGSLTEQGSAHDAAGRAGVGGAQAEAGPESLAEKGGRGTLGHGVALSALQPSPWSLPSLLAPRLQCLPKQPLPEPSSAAVISLPAPL